MLLRNSCVPLPCQASCVGGTNIALVPENDTLPSKWSTLVPTVKARKGGSLRKLTASLPRIVHTTAATESGSSTKGATPQKPLPLERGSGPVVVVDNYDSFTYNLCQYLGDLGCDFVVHRNDDLTIEELASLQPRGVLISPGPGTPDDSGISLSVVTHLGPSVPLFGVCMGLQCMGQAYGGNIVRAPNGVMHGKTSPVFHNQQDGHGLLHGLPNPFTACRYHSLVIDKGTFPEESLEVTAWTEDGLVMGVRHKEHSHVEGVQFHPESIITENGIQIVANFLKSMDTYWEQQRQLALEQQQQEQRDEQQQRDEHQSGGVSDTACQESNVV